MQYEELPVLSFQPLDAKEPKPKIARRLYRLFWLSRIALITAIVLYVTLHFLICPVRVKDGGMSPTVPRGKVVFISPAYRALRAGDLAVYECDYGTAPIYQVRRVIALAGESVEIRDGTVYVDGMAIEEDYIADAGEIDYPDVTVPEGYVFVLGDNRTSDTAAMIDERQIIGIVDFSLGAGEE